MKGLCPGMGSNPVVGLKPLLHVVVLIMFWLSMASIAIPERRKGSDMLMV